MNLYDLTKGNFHALRIVSYPEFPESKIASNVQTTAVSDSEWVSKINVIGRYDGPTDIVSVKDHQVLWTFHGDKLLESGTATLELSSGGSVHQVWSSIITTEEGFENFPPAGKLISFSISPFKIDGNSMSYEWKGTVSDTERR